MTSRRREPGAGRPGMYATPRFVAVVLAASVVAILLPGPAWLDLLVVNLAALVSLAIDVGIAPRPGSLQATWDVTLRGFLKIGSRSVSRHIEEGTRNALERIKQAAESSPGGPA